MKMRLHWQIFIGMALGILVGWLFGPAAVELKVIGDLFIKVLKLIAVPLIFAQLTLGVFSIGDPKKLGRIGIKTFVYFTLTTLISVGIGLVLVNVIQPGVGADLGLAALPQNLNQGPPGIKQLILNLVPDNIFYSLANTDVLGVVFFSLFFGFVLASIPEKAAVVVGFLDGVNEAMLRMTEIIMKIAPIGVFALMAAMIGAKGLAVLGSLVKYMLTVISGLVINAFIVLPLLLIVFARYSPRNFFKGMATALVTAFSTSSSAASLPITLESVEKRLGVHPSIVGFVMPLGATINQNGTALYESVAAMFIAQAYGIPMTLEKQLMIFLTAALTSIGATGIPAAGLVTLALVLKAVGLPLEGIGIILAVDRILDMCRTTVNVQGDAVGAVIIARSEKMLSPVTSPEITE
jgi:Na+/H+-dicarboxylate symporter